MSKWLVVATAILVLAVSQNANASITIDGAFSPSTEWDGAGFVTVNYNPAAPLGNFGSPTNENHVVGYDIFTTGDAVNFYIGIQALTPGPTGLVFANLYFDLDSTPGSDLGFEIFNDNAFIPGVPGSFDTTGLGIQYAGTDGDSGLGTKATIEVAIPWTVFTGDPLSMGYTPATTTVQLRLSQSLGYSVAGGATYGDARLGTLAVPAAVPEATSFVTFLLLSAVASLKAVRRNRQ